MYSVISQGILCTHSCNTHKVFFTVIQTKLPTEHSGLFLLICCRWQKVFRTSPGSTTSLILMVFVKVKSRWDVTLLNTLDNLEDGTYVQSRDLALDRTAWNQKLRVGLSWACWKQQKTTEKRRVVQASSICRVILVGVQSLTSLATLLFGIFSQQRLDRVGLSMHSCANLLPSKLCTVKLRTSMEILLFLQFISVCTLCIILFQALRKLIAHTYLSLIVVNNLHVVFVMYASATIMSVPEAFCFGAVRAWVRDHILEDC